METGARDQSHDALSRRNAIKAGAAALSGAAALMAQATDDKKPSGAPRKFRAWVTRGSGRNNGSVEELTMLPIKGPGSGSHRGRPLLLFPLWAGARPE